MTDQRAEAGTLSPLFHGRDCGRGIAGGFEMRPFRNMASAILLWAMYCVAGFSIELGPWQIGHPHPSDFLRGIAHDGEKYVLIDGYGHIFTSISGRNWRMQPTPWIRPLSGVAFGLDTFVTWEP